MNKSELIAAISEKAPPHNPCGAARSRRSGGMPGSPAPRGAVMGSKAFRPGPIRRTMRTSHSSPTIVPGTNTARSPMRQTPAPSEV